MLLFGQHSFPKYMVVDFELVKLEKKQVFKKCGKTLSNWDSVGLVWFLNIKEYFFSL